MAKDIVQQFFTEAHFDGTLEQLLTALEPQERANLTLKQQAQMFVLLWALDGYIKMLREHVRTGSGIRICNFAESAITELFGVDNLTDKAMAMANQIIADMPDRKPHKQAFAYKMALHDAYARKHGFAR